MEGPSLSLDGQDTYYTHMFQTELWLSSLKATSGHPKKKLPTLDERPLPCHMPCFRSEPPYRKGDTETTSVGTFSVIISHGEGGAAFSL